MKTLPILPLVCFFVTLFANSPIALAHKVLVFAYASGGEIVTETSFASGRPAQNSPIVVMDGNENTIVKGETDEQGIFRFPIPPQALQAGEDLLIIAEAGEGHRGTWLLRAADYGAQPPDGVVENVEEKPQPHVAHTGTDAPVQSSCEELERRIEETVAAELAPVKRMLAKEQTQQTSLQDILGGLGYIFGLAGIAFYFQARKKYGEK